MNVIDAIDERQSVRDYEKYEIDEKTIRKIIDAGRKAPSGNNAQPSRFYVVKSKEIKKRLKKVGVFKQDFVTDASIIIVCCSDPNAYTKLVGGWDEENEVRALRDISISSGFVALRAVELGFQTCFIGWINREILKEELDIPKDYLVPYVITVGKGKKPTEERGRKKLDGILVIK